MKPIVKISTGDRFERWSVIGRASSNGRRNSIWRVRCDCGSERDVMPDEHLTFDDAKVKFEVKQSQNLRSAVAALVKRGVQIEIVRVSTCVIRMKEIPK